MLTGDEYVDSLADGRRVYFRGSRVDRLEQVAEFAGSLRWAARGYDRWYVPTAGTVNPLLQAPRSVEDLQERVPLLRESDFMLDLTAQSLLALETAGARIGMSEPLLHERITAYIADAKARDIRVTECITDAKGDRSRRPGAQNDPDSYVRVIDRSPAGVVIRGAKLHISGAPLGHDLLVMPTKAMRADESQYAITCAVPANSPGVRIICTSYAPGEGEVRHFPVSAWHSVPEGFVVFDDVFVPSERVFLDGQVPHAAVFAHSLGLWERLGGVSFMADQADQLVGLAQLIAEANGTAGISHVREKIASMLIHATMLRAGLEAAIVNAERLPDGSHVPSELYTNAAKFQAAAGYHALVRDLHDIAGGSVITAPSMADVDHPEIGADIRKYMAGSDGTDGIARLRLFHLARDLTADALGGWNAVTALQSGGGLYAQRIVARKHYDMDRAKALAYSALEDAGLDH